MAVDKDVSLSIVKSELNKCQIDANNYGWEISALDENQLSFRVKMTSPIDNEIFIVSFKCDNYKELPPYIDFVDPISGQEGVKNAYPLNLNSFFHEKIVICHPCSRKAYEILHRDWKPSDWENNPKTGALKNIRAMLQAIYERIRNSEIYQGRMK